MKRWPSSRRTTGARTSHHGTTSAPWKTLRLAVPAALHIAKIRAELPNAEIVPVRLRTCRRSRSPGSDDRCVRPHRRARLGLHTAAPGVLGRRAKPNVYKVPLAYIVAGRDQPLVDVRQHVDRSEAQGRHHRRAVRPLDPRPPGLDARPPLVDSRRRWAGLKQTGTVPLCRAGDSPVVAARGTVPSTAACKLLPSASRAIDERLTRRFLTLHVDPGLHGVHRREPSRGRHWIVSAHRVLRLPRSGRLDRPCPGSGGPVAPRPSCSRRPSRRPTGRRTNRLSSATFGSTAAYGVRSGRVGEDVHRDRGRIERVHGRDPDQQLEGPDRARQCCASSG